MAVDNRFQAAAVTIAAAAATIDAAAAATLLLLNQVWFSYNFGKNRENLFFFKVTFFFVVSKLC